MRIQFISSPIAAGRAGESGVAIVAVTVFTLVLLTLGATFLRLATLERLSANEEVQHAQSFYLAEAGVGRTIAFLRVAGHATSTGPLYTNQPFANGTYTVTAADDLNRSVKIITSTGNFAGEQKTITVEVQLLPSFFKNTFSSGGDLDFYGILASAYAHGKTWLSGEYYDWITGWLGRGGMGFDELVENLPTEQTTLRFPDVNENGTANEFNDFVLYFRNALLNYSPSEVAWIQTDGTISVGPRSYEGKKLVFVEGSAPGRGNVNILFDAGSWWSPGQDLTIVSTGKVNYIQPLQNPSNSRLSMISWGNYTEGAIFYSNHRSVISTQTIADFRYLLSISRVTGSIFANQNIKIQEVIVKADFYYDESLRNGNIPPGLTPLCGTNYFLGDIVSWKEET